VLEKLALDLGIADRVDFLGDIPHIDCVRAVARADACVHTVLRDSQGVLCEAMQAGVPVITLDHLTPAMLVTPESGHLIPMNDNTRPEDIIDELADVMKQWHDDPTLLARKGQAAIERAQSFSPAAKGQEYRRLHRKVLEMLRNKSSTSTVAVHHPNPRTA